MCFITTVPLRYIKAKHPRRGKKYKYSSPHFDREITKQIEQYIITLPENWSRKKIKKAVRIYRNKLEAELNRKKQASEIKSFLKARAHQLKNRPTLAEAEFEQKLKKLQISYKSQQEFYFEGIGGIYDFYLPAYHLAIEVDGEYHQTIEQTAKDKERDWICKTYFHIQTLRLTNEEAFAVSIENLQKLIEHRNKDVITLTA